MVLSKLKDGLRKLFVDVPVGLFYWLTGALYYAFWYFPARFGVGVAQEITDESKKYMKRGRERAL